MPIPTNAMRSALVVIFISAIDQSIVATALPSMARDLGDFALISWVVTAYLITGTSVMPMSSAKFVEKKAYAFKPAIGLALGGIPAVLVAALIVKSMDVTTMRWLVVGVVLIAAAMMLRSAAKGE